ncbi:MAG: TIGR02680 family protein [Candidatus Polarisedimenticolaceae bacterium]|nr:TIGR02680 family protein [Candidatus Polarisedimenticolaceae bacterium]
MNHPEIHLPKPNKERWQPLRAGLVDIFYYDYQEFWFRDGRLLLRGNNGTGKSKVLALTLPFLLDGRAMPSRVEPDGDAQKRMEWNLLMGNRYNERTGYSWLEFGRLRQDGSTEIFTIGCAMKAVKGRPLTTWFFTTDQRVAQDFSLLDNNKRTLSKERLREALGEHAVIEQASRYRQVVDDKLFQLGPERYDALISLLIQLRQPQLSKRPDEKALSKALTEALPPIDPGILSDVADAFRNLEAERQELEGLRQTGQAVDEFRRHYRQYARVAGRRRAAVVRSAQSRHEKISSDLKQANASAHTAREEESHILAQIEETKTTLQKARARERTLQQSPEMRDANTLRQAEERAGEKEAELATIENESRNIAHEVEQRQQQTDQYRSQVKRSTTEIKNRNTLLAELAIALGIEGEHQRLTTPLQLPNGGEAVGSDDLRINTTENAIMQLYRRRSEQLNHIKHLNRVVDQALSHHRHFQEQWQVASDQLERLTEEQLEAEITTEQRGQALVSAFLCYCRELSELPLSDPDTVAESLRTWTITLEGNNPAIQALTSAFEIASHGLADEKAETTQKKEQQEYTLDELCQEKRRLEAGEEQQPPCPYTRRDASSPESRQHRPGAPLWKLIDFHSDTDPQLRATVEAALEASGLLDAWVLPEGQLLDSQTWDTLFTSGSPLEQNLAQILKPAVDRNDSQANAVSDPVLNALLVSIGWGQSDHNVWIDSNGQWQLGTLQGCWQKTEAEYIGHGARESARHRRLATLAIEISSSEAALKALQQQLDRLAQRKTQLDKEWKAAPDDEALRQAHRQVTTLIAQKQAQEAKVTTAAQRLAEAQTEMVQQCEARDLAAQDLDLPTETEALAELDTTLNNYHAGCQGFWPSLRHHWGLLDTLHQAQQALAQERDRLKEKNRRLSKAQRSAREATTHRDTLRETLGEAIAIVEQKLAQASKQIQQLERDSERLHQAQIGTVKRISAAATAVASHSEALLEHNRTRREAVNRLTQFATLGLLDAALPDHTEGTRAGEWPIDYALHLARSMEKQLQQVDDSDKAWQSQQHRLHERISELQSALSRHGHEASAEQNDDLIAVRVVFQSQRCDTERLAQRIADNIHERGELLDAKEQALLEEHLINELASHLQTLIQEAELTVNAMNKELECRPTSTGMKLRLKWKPLADGETWLDHTAPDGLSAARNQLLRQSAEVWSQEDRKAVGTFLKKQIDDARIAEESTALQEVMARALDYRYWHRFVVERWQDGEWRPAYGPASGGERVLVVTIPLFAAASSHYTSAGSHAPRLVLLDEAFAGVDDDSRAKSLGLLAQFDMDVVMTSEREWSCYAEVPGIAIAQLTRREGVDAVHVGHWWWDGKQRQRAKEPIPDLEAQQTLWETM